MATMSRFSCAHLYTQRDAQNLRLFNGWLLAAGAALIGATILIGEGFMTRGPAAWLLVGVAVLLLAISIRAYVRFLRGADELLRKIHVEGLALGFGAGILFMVAYRLLERLGAPKLDVNDPMLVMVSFWAIGQWIGMRRYAGEVEE